MASAGESDVDPSESGAKWRQYLRAMGPGLITGASDDDPSGIATYAHAGSKYGPSFLWAALLSIPTECIHLIIPRSWVRSPPALHHRPYTTGPTSKVKAFWVPSPLCWFVIRRESHRVTVSPYHQGRQG